jgi:hypothetical protein
LTSTGGGRDCTLPGSSATTLVEEGSTSQIAGPRGALLGRTQRAISKAAFATLSTPQLYTLTAVIFLPIYLPTLAFDPPPASAFPPAIGLSAMMAVTFGVTTEAIRRGPIGVSPIEGDILTVVVDVSPGWA